MLTTTRTRAKRKHLGIASNSAPQNCKKTRGFISTINGIKKNVQQVATMHLQLVQFSGIFIIPLAGKAKKWEHFFRQYVGERIQQSSIVFLARRYHLSETLNVQNSQ